MSDSDALFIPVILGTAREGRRSEHVARFVVGQVEKLDGVETALIDVARLDIPLNGPGDNARDDTYTSAVVRADGLILVVPEYNHGYPAALKNALDSCLKEYIHKAVGICPVSAGPFGGARVVENLLSVMRELGLVTIFWDLNFPKVQDAFDETGRLVDEAYVRRASKFLGELVWMARVLRHGRQHVPTP